MNEIDGVSGASSPPDTSPSADSPTTTDTGTPPSLNHGGTTVDTLVIHANKVIIGAEEPDAAPPSRRHVVNALLLAGTLILVTTWYLIHLESYVKQIMVVGGLTIFALWKVIQSLMDLRKKSGEVRQRILGHENAREYLVAALCVIVVLLATTSSIYLKYEGHESQGVRLRVTDERGNELTNLSATPDRRNDGGPIFLRFRLTDQVRVEVVDPPGYDPEDYSSFRPWSHLELAFPQSFTRHKYRLLRIVPGQTLLNELPGTDDEAIDYVLTVQFADGATHEVEDLRFETIYLGADQDDLRRLVPSLHGDTLRAELVDYLAGKGVPDEARDLYLSKWMSDRRAEPTPEFDQDERISLRVTRKNRNPGDPPVAEDEITMGPETVTSVFLEKS